VYWTSLDPEKQPQQAIRAAAHRRYLAWMAWRDYRRARPSSHFDRLALKKSIRDHIDLAHFLEAGARHLHPSRLP
jgi:hypothetical protein